jgi:hypothetical protein
MPQRHYFVKVFFFRRPVSLVAAKFTYCIVLVYPVQKLGISLWGPHAP